MLGDSSGVGAIFKPFDRSCENAEGRKHCFEVPPIAHIDHLIDWFAHLRTME
jgi:hypothetical protein